MLIEHDVLLFGESTMTSSDNELLYAELSKINKKDIIQALVYNKYNDGISASSVLSDFFEKISVNRVSHTHNEDSLFCESRDNLQLPCKEIECLKGKMLNDSMKLEIRLLNQNIFHMEKRLEDQNEIITLLKNQNNGRVVSAPPSTFVNAKFKDKVDKSEKRKTKPNKSALQISNQDNIHKDDVLVMNDDKSHQMDAAGGRDAFVIEQANTATNVATVDKMTVNKLTERTENRVSRKSRQKPIVGTNSSTRVLQSVPKMGYLHVYRLDPKTTANDLELFLKDSAPDIVFGCKELKKTERSCSLRARC